jgi:hypothetical protein
MPVVRRTHHGTHAGTRGIIRDVRGGERRSDSPTTILASVVVGPHYVRPAIGTTAGMRLQPRIGSSLLHGRIETPRVALPARRA